MLLCFVCTLIQSHAFWISFIAIARLIGSWIESWEVFFPYFISLDQKWSVFPFYCLIWNVLQWQRQQLFCHVRDSLSKINTIAILICIYTIFYRRVYYTVLWRSVGVVNCNLNFCLDCKKWIAAISFLYFSCLIIVLRRQQWLISSMTIVVMSLTSNANMTATNTLSSNDSLGKISLRKYVFS